MEKRNSILALTAMFAFLVFPLILGSTTTTKPDLKVTDLTATRVTTDQVPLRINIYLRIVNRGSASTGATYFVTRLYYRIHSNAPWQTLFDFPSGPLSANGGGGHYNRSFDFSEGGTYTFKAETDANKVISESSEGNNTKTTTKTFAAGTPDLIIENLNASTVNLYANGNWKAKVEWDVKNIGDGKAQGSFTINLKVYKNGSSSGAELQSYTRSNLNPGSTLHFSKISTFSNLTSLRFKVTVDSTSKIHEKSESNNTNYSNTINNH